MNQLHVGFTRKIALPKGSFLFIDDELPRHPKAKIFEPRKHCFNPLKKIDHKTAREIADVLYTTSPQGESTLTVRNGRRALAQALAAGERLDRLSVESKIKGVAEEVEGMIDDILFSPVLERALCSDDDFGFGGRNTKVFARINRAEPGDFDALVLGLFLMAHFNGQVVVPDFGFDGRDAHVALIHDERLIAGVNTLGELPPALRRNVLLIEDKVAAGTTLEDAETLAAYARFARNTNGFNDFVRDAMA